MSTIAEFDFSKIFDILLNIGYQIIKIPMRLYAMLPTWVVLIIKTLIILLTIIIAFAWYKNRNEWKKVYRS